MNLTVDFDFTLTEGIFVPATGWESGKGKWLSSDRPFMPVLNFVKLFHKCANVSIVTFRKPKFADDIKQFISRFHLNVNEVLFTAGEPKIDALRELKSDIHIDDDVFTLIAAHSNSIRPIWVNQTGEKNCVAERFYRLG